jgi:adenylate cyclase
VGLGVHTGLAFVGVIGTDEHLDFSALGDTVNTAARLGSTAGPGRLLISRDAWGAGGRSGTDATAVDVAGRRSQVDVFDLGRDELKVM